MSVVVSSRWAKSSRNPIVVNMPSSSDINDKLDVRQDFSCGDSVPKSCSVDTSYLMFISLSFRGLWSYAMVLVTSFFVWCPYYGDVAVLYLPVFIKVRNVVVFSVLGHWIFAYIHVSCSIIVSDDGSHGFLFLGSV